MRLLHPGSDHERHRPDPGGAGRDRCRTRARVHERQYLPLRRVPGNNRGGAAGTEGHRCGEPQGGRMKSFDYVRPASMREAVTAAAAPGAAYLAAGTNLIDLMKGGVTAPKRLVDITHL